MDGHRRSLMPQDGTTRSHIPMPSTAKKPPSNSRRMSTLGPAGRAPLIPPSTNPRQSMARSINNQSLLASTSKPLPMKTPLHNSVRRTSVWGGSSVIPPPTSSQPMKDTRPLRDKAYQSKMRQEVTAYLQENGYDIASNTLQNIQGKEYRAIFEFLTLRLDPNYAFFADKRFEDQFVPALRAIAYPYAHVIDNKWLAAPASMHSWPALLGCLHWLVELCKLRDDYLNSQHPTLQDPQFVPDDFDDKFDHAALGFDFYASCYAEWMQMKDVFMDSEQDLIERYNRRNASIRTALEQSTAEYQARKQELKKLEQSQPPLNKLIRDNGLLKTDSEKFAKILEKYDSRKKKLNDTIAREKAELEEELLKVDKLKAEQERLQEIVKEQNLSPEEVMEMNQTHETLTRTLEDLKQKIAETHKQIMAHEVSATNRVAAVEEALDQYTNLLSNLELFPPLEEPWENIDLTLELNPAASNPQQLLVGSDIRKVVKPTLSAIAESKRVERSALETERIKVDDELDQVIGENENMEGEIADGEKKIATLTDQADSIRDATQLEAQVASDTANKLERDMAAARTAAAASGMGVKSRLQALQIDYNEQIAKVARLKEDTVRNIIKSSTEIAMFKKEVSRHLTELSEFVTAE